MNKFRSKLLTINLISKAFDYIGKDNIIAKQLLLDALKEIGKTSDDPEIDDYDKGVPSLLDS
jgi:hypothetical protein